ncbi:hypothetical protein GTU73_16725 [Rathayibacter sp. VKM Ac-2804]|uniref:hypothetical protein n=1 Tax=Rathayibacter sp. VKM Ac-2804 TaxID=2609257 RepID=UPI00132E988D|nr:hypothetical protein [Rathayibacter sp. VKM Ac-2804]QHF25472.1 hypothetical protein GTU73_16725 [Rathayibacter sp. VKM Ac-2804]
MAFGSDADWADPDPFDRPPRRKSGRRLSVRQDRGTAILLLVLLLMLGAVLSFFVLVEHLAADRCGGALGECDYELLSATTVFVPGVVALTVLLTIVALVRRGTSRRIWWIPATGVLGAVLAFLLASGLAFVAVH